MKKVMVRAWTIARQGQEKFGGKVKEYFAQALAMAWAEYKSTAKQLAAIEKKGLKIYNNYIQTLIERGATLVSEEGTDVVLSIPQKGHRKNLSVSFEMNDLDAFAKTVIGKKVQYFNLGSAV